MYKFGLNQKRLLIVAVGLLYILTGIGEMYYPDFFSTHRQIIKNFNFIIGMVALGMFFNIKKMGKQNEKENSQNAESEKNKKFDIEKDPGHQNNK